MKIKLLRHVAQGRFLGIVFAFALLLTGYAPTPANAARRPPPLPVIITVAPPAGVQVLSVSSTGMTATETPASGYVLAVRWVSGALPPCGYTCPFWTTSGTTVALGGLLPNTNYVFEMRRVSINGQLVNSGFTRFSFQTRP
jgi:hypothetical protein